MNKTNTDAKPSVMHRKHRKRTLMCGYVDRILTNQALANLNTPPPLILEKDLFWIFALKRLLFVKGTLLPGCIFSGYNFSWDLFAHHLALIQRITVSFSSTIVCSAPVSVDSANETVDYVLNWSFWYFNMFLKYLLFDLFYRLIIISAAHTIVRNFISHYLLRTVIEKLSQKWQTKKKLRPAITENKRSLFKRHFVR